MVFKRAPPILFGGKALHLYSQKGSCCPADAEGEGGYAEADGDHLEKSRFEGFFADHGDVEGENEYHQSRIEQAEEDCRERRGEAAVGNEQHGDDDHVGYARIYCGFERVLF